MKYLNLAAIVFVSFSLIFSCQKEELKTDKPQKGIDVSCESGNNWCINQRQYLTPVISKCYAMKMATFTKYHWEDNGGNTIDLEVTAHPENNQVISVNSDQIQSLKVKVVNDVYSISPEKFPLKNGMITISNQSGVLYVNLNEIEVFDNVLYYINFRICQLEVKLK